MLASDYATPQHPLRVSHQLFQTLKGIQGFAALCELGAIVSEPRPEPEEWR